MDTVNWGRFLRRCGLVVIGTTALISCSTTAPPPPAPPKVDVRPVAGAADISPADPVKLDVTGGRLDNVELTSADGKKIPGELAPDGRSWKPTEQLEFGESYTWSGTANGQGGTRSPVDGSFTTVEPSSQPRATINIGDGQEVGVAAPIIIDFAGPVQDRAAVEKALSVHTSEPTEGSWAWLPDTQKGSRVHWRPKEYWKPGTKVTVDAPLYGVPFGDGAYGQENLTSHFNIGRSQIVKADVTSHQMQVIRDGQQVANYDASYGLASDPDRATRSGIHVVSGKAATQRMTSAQYNYDLEEKWAVRLSNNGEFIHANPASSGSQGSSNVTHGCVNLSNADGHEYFQSAMYGDPVEVTNSGKELSEADGDIWDWTVPWDEWRGMSALSQPEPPAPPPAHPQVGAQHPQ